VLIASLAAVAGAPAAGAAGSSSAPAFSPGRWTGTVTETGNVVIGNIAGTVSGSWDFAFTITRRGTVQAGATISGRDDIAASGPDGSVVGTNMGTMALEGSSARILGFGTLQSHVEVAGFPPVDGDVPGQTYLDPVKARCRVVSGDAASVARLFQRAAGATITPSAMFVAHRSGGNRVRQSDVDKQRANTVAALKAFLRDPTSSLLLTRAATQVKELNGIVASADACGAPPQGFEHGVTGNRAVSRLIVQMLSEVESKPAPYPLAALMTTLEAALEVGYADLAQQLEDALEAKITATPATSANKAALEGVYQAAQLYGLSALANVASARLAGIP
jgi:hypothetical protein